jgi:hypothetical protein
MPTITRPGDSDRHLTAIGVAALADEQLDQRSTRLAITSAGRRYLAELRALS